MSQVITLLKTVLATLPLFVGKFRFLCTTKLVCVSGKKLIPFFSGSIAVGVPDSLNGSPCGVIAYLLTGKTPVALKSELMLRGHCWAPCY